MKTIKLYGQLGKKFGKIHRFDVKSPIEAICALKANFKDFSEYLIKHSLPGYSIRVGKEETSLNNLANPLSNKEVIKIIPIVAGANGNGVTQIIAGIALILAAPYLGPMAAIATGSAYADFISAGMVYFGQALVLGGTAQILFSPPVPRDVNSTENPSYSFNGVVNTVKQGNPVPVGYGRLRVGSQVISGGLFARPI